MVYELRGPFYIHWRAYVDGEGNFKSIKVKYIPGTDDPSYPHHHGFQGELKVQAVEAPPQYFEAIGRIASWAREQQKLGKPLAIGKLTLPSPLWVASLTVRDGQVHAEFVVKGEDGGTQESFNHVWSISQLPATVAEDLQAVEAFLNDSCLEHLMTRAAKLTGSIEAKFKWVFISYADVTPDKEFAARLARAVRDLPEFRPWFFPWEVRWADDQREKMDEGIAKSDAGIIVFTPYYREHAWADYEYSGLVVKRVEERAHVGIALLNGDPSNISPPMRSLHYADFRDPNNFDKEFWKIARGLRGLPIETP